MTVTSARWPVVIVGAGPAGSATAISLRRRGLRVLLVERKLMPRPKVCGGCLGPRTVAILRGLGVDPFDLPDAQPLTRLMVAGWRRTAEFDLPGGVAVSRDALDLRLFEAARAAGADVATQTVAEVGPVRPDSIHVRLSGTMGGTVEAGLVVLAAGLPASPRPGEPANARIGLGQARVSAGGLPNGTVLMAAARDGYVGLVHLAGNRLNVAASVTTTALARAGLPGTLVDQILMEAGQPPLLWRGGWQGTPPLRHFDPLPAGERTLRVGDAGGFWEPFTGEGIGWALEAGLRVAEPAVSLSAHWADRTARRWAVAHARWVRRQQRRSRLVGFLMTTPALGRTAILLARALPRTSRRLVPGAVGGTS